MQLNSRRSAKSITRKAISELLACLPALVSETECIRCMRKVQPKTALCHLIWLCSGGVGDCRSSFGNSRLQCAFVRRRRSSRVPSTYLYPIPVSSGRPTHLAAVTKPTAVSRTSPVYVCRLTIDIVRADVPTADWENSTEMGNTATTKKGDANENGKQSFDPRSTTAETFSF